MKINKNNLDQKLHKKKENEKKEIKIQDIEMKEISNDNLPNENKEKHYINGMIQKLASPLVPVPVPAASPENCQVAIRW